MSRETERLARALAERYTIEGEIGQGGMATVYLAHDLRHDRRVAIKVLRPDIAASLGAERFLREVRIAASLTHPHVLGLYDSGEADGFLYYVMPYIEGDSLRERLAREGELPVQDAVRILREVTDALAYAHGQNVVHRDIKPDNVMLSGRHALVTDFGVAKAVSEATGRDKLTTLGVALGTPTYMAPEQAAADPHIDHRADLYALGVVAYELLTGEPPFTGATQHQILAAHLSETPRPLRERRASLPPALDQLVMKCLEKRASDRWQTAEEILQVLEGLGTPSVGMTPVGTRPVTGLARPPSGRKLAFVAGAAATVAVIGFLGWSSLRSAGPIIETAGTRQVTRGLEMELDPAISPDGREVAYAVWSGDRKEIHVRDLEGGRAIVLAEDSLSRYPHPRWSPDGRSVLYNATGGAVSVPRFGGPATRLSPGRVAGVGPGGSVVQRGDSLFLRPGSGGDERLITVADLPYGAALSPDGERLAYVTGNGDYVTVGPLFGNVAPSTIWVVAVDGGTPVQVTTERALNTSPVWLPDARDLLFVSDRDGPRDLYVVRLTSSGVAEHPPVRVTTGLEPHSVAVSADGSRAVYSRFIFRRNIWEVPLRSGETVSLEDGRPLTSGNQVVESHGVSPDGRSLAFDANLEGNQDIFVMDLEGGEPRRLTTDPADEFNPDFSPDGGEIAFHSAKHGSRDIFVMNADGSAVQRVTEQPGQEFHAAFSPDGLHLAYGYVFTPEESPEDDRAIFVVSRDGVGEAWGPPRRVSRGNAWYARWSPDGTRLVAESRDGFGFVVLGIDGADERPLLEESDVLSAATWPDFSLDGSVIYFNGVDADGRQGLYSVPVDGGAPRLVVHYPDPSKPVWPMASFGDGVAYLSVAEHESDVYVMDLVVR